MPQDSQTQPQWWTQPFRVFQTNIREIDAVLDEKEVVSRIRELGANAWLLNTAGIVSFFPSKLAHQHPSPWLQERASGDLIGDAVREAHANGIKLISRCDFSKVHQDVYEAHPDWCYVSPKGQLQIYNGLYSTCPSAPYYQEKSIEIIGEVMDRYPIDGFFFNWFNFPLRDYSHNYYGICQCSHCRRRFEGRYNMELPREEDWNNPAYLRWREYSRETLDELAGRIRNYIKERNPNVCLILNRNPDVIMHEVNNAVDRPQPIWVNWAGEVARQSRTAHPEKPVVINSVMFLDIPYRFSAEQPGLVGLHLAQTISQGVNPWAYVLGTTDQPDRKNFGIVGEMLRFHRDHEEYYAGLRSAAKVAVISSLRTEERYGRAEGIAKVQNALRGAYRALLEGHVPFDILPDEHLGAAAESGRLQRYEALVLPNIATLDDSQLATLDHYVENGGGLVATYDTSAFDPDGQARSEFGLQSLGAHRIAARREGPHAMRSAYFRVTRREDLPNSDDTDFVALDRAYLYVEPRQGAVPSLSLIPPERYGPPEKCYWDVETDHPGLLWNSYGRGRTAYFPWPVDALFYTLSLPEYRTLLVNAVTQVSAGGRQVVTNAPPQVEVVVGQ
ncbi:MAG TPA: beta-galactosidase trimerization domain-containing protein, partial [Chloroflexota bacterium]|nr:beta-galactosidase trimerization domain-containing protein [Chloroflexota bacterium]